MRIDAPFPPHPRAVGVSLKVGKRALARKQDALDKEVLWLRQGGCCFYCADPMVYHGTRKRGRRENPRAMTIDHVLTRSVGGREGPKVGACFRCNTTRGSMPAHDFIMVVARRQGLLAP